MRLLYVCNDFGITPSGTKGASVHLRAITSALAGLGHDVELVSPKPGPAPDHPLRRVLVPGCPPVDSGVKPLKRWLLDCGLDDALARDLRPLMYNAWVGPRLVEAFADRPPEAILERLSLFSTVGSDLAQALNVPLIIEVNAILSREAAAYRTLHLSDMAVEIERRVLTRADAVVAVSSDLHEQLIELGVSPDRICCVPNGADIDLLDSAPPREVCRGRLGWSDAFVVGFVGSLKPWHGVEVLVDAFVSLSRLAPEARLLIVGDGPHAESIVRRIEAAGIHDRVIMTGAVEHEQVAVLLHAMDVAVAPYLSQERFYFSPMKVFESMAARVCTIASRAGQIELVIRDGHNGVLVNPGDAADLARQLTALHNDAIRRGALADAGRQTIEHNYTWSHAASRVAAVIERTLEGRHAPAATTTGIEVVP